MYVSLQFIPNFLAVSVPHKVGCVFLHRSIASLVATLSTQRDRLSMPPMSASCS